MRPRLPSAAGSAGENDLWAASREVTSPAPPGSFPEEAAAGATVGEEAPPAVLTVTELTRQVRALLEEEVGRVWVEGEVSNHRRQSSGHAYFTLKDDGSQLDCVLFRGHAAASGAGRLLADGVQVRVYGELTVYEARGRYQLVVQLVRRQGVGTLQARFEALKNRLWAEGLFDPARKRPLPGFPRSVVLVTSPTGAALQDILQILRRRAPWVRVLVYPVRVQGRGAAAEITRAVRELNAWAAGAAASPAAAAAPAWWPDAAGSLLVVTRGGGSLEDLWEFNDEALARAVAASALPVVSAVGHEIDFTIVDFAADLRAPTPSAAAELIAPDGAAERRRLAQLGRRLDQVSRNYLESARLRWKTLARQPALTRAPQRWLHEARLRVDGAEEGLRQAAAAAWQERARRAETLRQALGRLHPRRGLARQRAALAATAARLRAAAARQGRDARARVDCIRDLLRVLGPQATLERGYSIATDAEGRVLRSSEHVYAGTQITVRLARGQLRARVAGTEPG